MLKVKITWNDQRRRYEVYETEGAGKPDLHHSFHRTQAEALRVQRAQQAQNQKEAAK